MPGEGTVTYIASSSDRNITTKISGTMIEVEAGSNILKTDATVSDDYDNIEFFYTSESDGIEYTSGRLKIDKNLENPCFYSYAFIELQNTIAKQPEYYSYYFDASELETQALSATIETGTYIQTNDEGTTEGLSAPFVLTATSEKGMDIVEQNNTFENGITTTKKLRLRGQGNINYRSINFETKGASTITACIISASSTAVRSIGLYNYNGSVAEIVDVTVVPVSSETPTVVATYNISNPGQYFIASTNSGIDISYVKVEEYYKPIFNGAWKEYGSINNPQEDVHDISEGTYVRDNSGSTYYADVSVYDYYTDWELAGNSLYDITYETYTEADGYYKLQGLIQNKTISEYFRTLDTNGVAQPLYFGMLKASANVGLPEYLQKILYNGDTKANNSKVSAAVQKLVDDVLNSNQNLTIKNIEAPYFNKEYLEGNNHLETVVGKVYDNVELPFIRNDETGNWEYSSEDADQTLLLKQDSATGQYYFDKVGADEAILNNNQPNFFPLSNSLASGKHSNKNFFFGIEINLKFTLTSDGKINVYDENGNVISKNILFNFAGDDDVWVYIDGKQVLDIGGTHQKIAGTIDFATGYSAITYATFDGATAVGNSNVATFKTAVSNGISSENIITRDDGNLYFVYGTENGASSDNYYLAKTFDNTEYLDGEEHTLTMFYMERGSASSNMDISFNFPIQDFLEVSNTVDTSNANEIFSESLAKLPNFEFIIKTMATVGGPLSVEESKLLDGFEKDDTQISDYNSISDTNTSNGLQLISGINYLKTNNDGTTSENTITDGKIIINNNEKISFSDKFRTGSYIQIVENISDDVKKIFETTWEIKQEDVAIINTGQGESIEQSQVAVTGTGYSVNDNRTASSSYSSVSNIVKPADGSMLYRNYVTPDSTLQIDLQVEYTNKLRVGDIVLEKQVQGEDINTEFAYEFLIEFSNVAGMNLEDAPITKTVSLKHGETITISGIPIGTQYKIVEIHNLALQEILYENAIHSDISLENLEIVGTVAETNGVSSQKYTFVNNDITKGHGIIEITKIDAKDSNIKLANATFKLEKVILNAEQTEWIVDTNFTPIEVITDEQGLAIFSKLDTGKYRISEVKAPDGYNLANEVIEVELTLDNLKQSFTISNKAKTILPIAGDRGRHTYYIAGTVVILFALFRLRIRKVSIKKAKATRARKTAKVRNTKKIVQVSKRNRKYAPKHSKNKRGKHY